MGQGHEAGAAARIAELETLAAWFRRSGSAADLASLNGSGEVAAVAEARHVPLVSANGSAKNIPTVHPTVILGRVRLPIPRRSPGVFACLPNSLPACFWVPASAGCLIVGLESHHGE